MAAGIYVSVPFCAQKCTYCNFASNVFADELRRPYIDGVARELESLEALEDADTLYFGGGSPSMLSAAEFSAMTAPIRGGEWREATIEVAPGDVTPERVEAWQGVGIDRVSFGVQSFVPTVARASGRRHTPEIILAEVELLRRSGIRNFSVDLIAGLAHQTEATWAESLNWIKRLGAPHVSVYMLEVDDDSRLGKELRDGGSRYGAASTPSEEQITDFYLTAVERLSQMGLERYEVSNFARTDAESVHNKKYWRMEPYFGCGSDAHSFDGVRRWANAETATEYVRRLREGAPVANEPEVLSADRLFEDRVLTGIRTREGVVPAPYEWEGFAERAGRAIGAGLLVRDEEGLRVTDRGFLFVDDIVSDLLGQSQPDRDSHGAVVGSSQSD